MEIPQDVYEHVLGVAVEMANASTHGDTRSQWRLHDELRQYCDAMAVEGRDHPFLWETLGDFTSDSGVAIGYYERALTQARQLGVIEGEASICLELARRHIDQGETGRGYEFALLANEAGRQTDDLDLRREISQFLLENT